jgi:BirA family biotin operon repressor/biotin-[acetyl-CoA-carboxylase] ligase
LADATLADDGRARLCIAEHQRAGRGRRGRHWHASAGGSITFSLTRRFDQPPSGLLGLALVAGVAAASALAANGVADLALKWPNDIQIGDAKLGGILVELAGESSGPTRAVVGLGVNYDLTGVGETEVPNAVDLRRAVAYPVDRSQLAGALMASLVGAFDRFEQDGLEPFLARWRELDVLKGREVRLDAPGGAITGVAEGVDDEGALRLNTATGTRRFLSGDVSVRAAP